MGFSTTHLIIIFVIVLIIFGPGKLSQVGKSLGSAINEFKNSVNPQQPKAEDKKEEEDKTEKTV